MPGDGPESLPLTIEVQSDSTQEAVADNLRNKQVQSVVEPAVIAERRRSAGIACGILAVMAALIFALPLVLGVVTFNGLIGGLLAFTLPAPTIAEVETSRTIVMGIQPLGQLVSVSAQLAKAEILVNISESTGLNACGFWANHVAEATIEGGIDLSQITDEHVDYDPVMNRYAIQLPAPQLTSCRIDSIRQYNRSFTACAVDWDEARILGQYQAMVDFREDALEGGILDRARLEAQLVISNFVQALTGTQTEITFAEPTVATAGPLPASCNPQLPAGWLYDEIARSWIKNP